MTRLLKEKWPHLLIGTLLCVLAFSEARIRGDFDIFFLATKDMLKGENIYHNTYFTWFHYYYSPFFACILAPFTLLNVYWVKVGWFLLNCFFAFQTWQCLRSFLPWDKLTQKAKTIISILAFVFVLKFLRDNLHNGQVSILMLYLCIQGLLWIIRKKTIPGAFFLALGIDIKILPLVFLPYLLYRGEWKTFLWILVFLTALLMTPGFFLGLDYLLFLNDERLLLLNPMNAENIVDTLERSYHSLTTFLAVFLLEHSGDKFEMPIKRNIANVSIEQLTLIIQITRAFFIFLTLYFIRSWPFQKATSSLQYFYEISYICLAIPLIFPHQQHYAFLFAFPAITYMLFFLYTKYFSTNNIPTNFVIRKWVLVCWMSLIFLSMNLHFILGAFSEYYDHFKILTFGALALVVLLAICKPRKLNSITAD